MSIPTEQNICPLLAFSFSVILSFFWNLHFNHFCHSLWTTLLSVPHGGLVDTKTCSPGIQTHHLRMGEDPEKELRTPFPNPFFAIPGRKRIIQFGLTYPQGWGTHHSQQHWPCWRLPEFSLLLPSGNMWPDPQYQRILMLAMMELTTELSGL